MRLKKTTFLLLIIVCNSKTAKQALKIMDPIVPHWHTAINKIKLPKSLEHLIPDPNFDCILPNVNLKALIAHLSCGNNSLITQAGLFKEGFQDRKTEEILEHWKQGTKLMPPSIMVAKNNQGLCISDGRHRINAAFYYQQECIPIIISKADLENALSLLSIRH